MYNNNHRGLRLDISLNRDAFESSMNATYRKEGLSVGSDHMRLYGEAVPMEVSFADLIMGERIGQGACSSVNLARHKRTNDIYAIKMFNVSDQSQESQLYNEIFLLTSFQCDALIALKGVFHNQGCIGVIIEFMDRGSLEFILQPEVRMTEPVMAAVAFQIIWGLGYLHYEKQIHRDIKPANILMNSKGEVKLSDFGISKELDSSTAMSHTAVGSYRYMSPERLLGEKYDASGDIWSVGITIIQLWTKIYPFSAVADTPIELFGELEHFNFDRVVNKVDFPPRMRQFLRSTLAVNPENRLTCNELAGSDWFVTCGVNSLIDAHNIVKHWVEDEERRKAKHSSISADKSRHKDIKSSRPPRRDENQMSISLEASKSWAESSSGSSHMSSSNSYGSNNGSSSYSRHGSGGGVSQRGGQHPQHSQSHHYKPYDAAIAEEENDYGDEVFEEVAEDDWDGDRRQEHSSNSSRSSNNNNSGSSSSRGGRNDDYYGNNSNHHHASDYDSKWEGESKHNGRQEVNRHNYRHK